ncbi:serine/threonine-protein kinase M1 [Serendipita sp. 411]|nr:serine/threonine-protein kinase M1 [Serendipita sp. 411]
MARYTAFHRLWEGSLSFRTYHQHTKQYTETILSLSDMLSQFPKYQGASTRQNLDQELTLANLSLDAVERVCKRMEGALANQESTLMWRLLTCVSTLDDWDIRGTTNLENLNSLRLRILQTLANAFRIRAIDESFVTGKGFEEGLSSVNRCLGELLSTSQAILRRESISYPVTVPLFEDQHQSSLSTLPAPFVLNAISLRALPHVRAFATSTLQLSIFFIQHCVHLSLSTSLSSQLAESYTQRQCTQVLKALEHLVKFAPDRTGTQLQVPLLHILSSRLNDPLEAGCEFVDSYLSRLLDLVWKSSCVNFDYLGVNYANIQAVLTLDIELKNILTTYLAHYSAKCPKSQLQQLYSLCSVEPRSGALEQVLELIRDRLNSRLSEPMEIDQSTFLVVWHVESHQRLQDGLLSGLDILPSDLDYTRWQNAVIYHASELFSRELSDKSAANRLKLARDLLKFPKELLPPADRKLSSRTTFSLIMLYTTATIRLLDGPPTEVTNAVWRCTYLALAEGIRKHCQSGQKGLNLEKIFRLLEKGLEHRHRPVRLAAGQVIMALYELSEKCSNGSFETMTIIRRLEHPLQRRPDHIKETTILTLGLVGEIASLDSISFIVFPLIRLLGDANPVLRASSLSQLLNLSKRDKSPYNLVARNIAKISLHAAINCVKQPLLLRELCRFISYSPPSFFSQTVPHFLPQLVGQCRNDELEAIARMMDTSIAALIVENSAEVFEYLFLIETTSEMSRAIDLVVGVLTQQSDAVSRSLGITPFVKNRLNALLGKIVIRLGDDSVLQPQVLNAIERVQEYSADPSPKTGNSGEHPTANVFLQQHITGVITYLNNELHEAHGKLSVAEKHRVMRALTEVVALIGEAIAVVSPQLFAIMQNTIRIDGLTEATLRLWLGIAMVLRPSDFGPYLALTSAIIVKLWDGFDTPTRDIAQRILLLIANNSGNFNQYLNNLASLDTVDELHDIHAHLKPLLPELLLGQRLIQLSTRIMDLNASVSHIAILEAKRIVSDQRKFLPFVTEDNFDPAVGSLIKALQSVAGREGEIYDEARLATFECLGIIGAADPDRFAIPNDSSNILSIFCDFSEETASQEFAAYLIVDVLAPIFPKTSDIQFQKLLAFTLQELLAFCEFSDALISQDMTISISVKVRKRWMMLPGDVQAMVAPLLRSKYMIEGSIETPSSHPVYPSVQTYKEWIQKFTSYLIGRVDRGFARSVFQPFRALLGSDDVQVLLFILPHLVVDLLSNGNPTEISRVREEIIAVLEDQLHASPNHTSDMKRLCAQTIFQLMDHLNRYLRVTGVLVQGKKYKGTSLQNHRQHIELLTMKIDHDLIAQAAVECKQYARALMGLEQQVLKLRSSHSGNEAPLQTLYEKMHEMYCNLDEPDGMNGISAEVLTPTLEHQIREHESNGRWTAAQSCWEVSLQSNPDDLESHIGLLRCLRNLGHYDTMRTHLIGILSRNPAWSDSVEPFRLEGAWAAHDWISLEGMVSSSSRASPELSIARILLSLRTRHGDTIQDALTRARIDFGQPIGSAGPSEYRRTYEASLHLHMVEELSLISRTMDVAINNRQHDRTRHLSKLSDTLDARYQSVLPSYRTLEPILNIRRTAFDLLNTDIHSVNIIVGKYWLNSSKIARKAGHFQAAYSALLQGRQRDAPFHFVQGCKLLQSDGESIRALQELNNSLETISEDADVIELTTEDDARLKAKAWLLRVRWMQASERYSRAELNAQFSRVAQVDPRSESVFFYWALYLDRSQEHRDIPTGHLEEYLNHIDHVVRHYGRSLLHGSKHLYQTVPRMLTLWLNLGQRQELATPKGMSSADHPYRTAVSKYGRLCEWIKSDLIKEVDPFKWLTAFPQIVSRLIVNNNMVKGALFTMIGRVIQEFPQQSLWIITGVAASSKHERRESASRALGFCLHEKYIPKTASTEERTRTVAIIERVRPLIRMYVELNEELLHLCNFDVENIDQHRLSAKCPKLAGLRLSEVIVPLQDSFTAKIPSMSSQILQNQTTLSNLPTIHGFGEKIVVMPSLQKPRKISITASNGEEFNFLCKPKDDLRKDARLMDFNAVVNKLLRANSESRRRQLHIRTYSVVPLNEECGLIEWVKNTVAFRAILRPRYDAVGTPITTKRYNEYFDKFKQMSAEKAGTIFKDKILSEFKPIFHQWFLETFPEPMAWFTSRLAYSRTAAVISMVGYIIGLGDRHCENIMLDTGTGETVHCDFNCLFDKGKQFEVPELVPFRLTQNVIDGMGITGVEGCFRISSEITMDILRSNQDCLMSVLEAFIHDPLVEWEDERRRKERHRSAVGRGPVDLKKLALGALDPIERKLRGIEGGTQISVSNQVDKLIQEATSDLKLGKMYVGWTPWV